MNKDETTYLKLVLETLLMNCGGTDSHGWTLVKFEDYSALDHWFHHIAPWSIKPELNRKRLARLERRKK